MTSSSRDASRASPREHEIVNFLRANPDFLDHHPELLAAMTIPHASGDAVSLLERQVAVLREENSRLKRQLDELIRLARQNEQLNGRIQALVLTLMNAVGPQAIFTSLERCLREEFGADRVCSLIFAEPSFADAGHQAHFVGAETARRAPFADILGAGHTRCGALAAAQREALFGAGAHAGSAVVMPLRGRGWDGVLVIASDSSERYQAGMGTEFLDYLRDIVTLVVEPWVKRAKAG
jgi:uncharacterized protein YigA (DUF484 family)